MAEPNLLVSYDYKLMGVKERLESVHTIKVGWRSHVLAAINPVDFSIREAISAMK
jgi:hypothetical protein